MDVFDAARTVLAVRSYQDKPVPAALVHKILEAARLTGNSRNGQPWHFILVDDKAMLKRMADSRASSKYFADAPLAVVVGYDKSSVFGLSDGSRAIQSMIMTAWAEGVGSNWVGWVGMPEIKPLLGVPDTVELIAIVPFGYPTLKLGKGRKKRKPVSEVVHHGRFGQPYK